MLMGWFHIGTSKTLWSGRLLFSLIDHTWLYIACSRSKEPCCTRVLKLISTKYILTCVSVSGFSMKQTGVNLSSTCWPTIFASALHCKGIERASWDTGSGVISCCCPTRLLNRSAGPSIPRSDVKSSSSYLGNTSNGSSVTCKQYCIG